MRRNKKYNNVEKAVLIALISGAVFLSPMGGRVVVGIAKYYIKKWCEKGGPYIPPEKDPKQVRQSIYKLKRNDYIRWKYNKRKDIVKLELTKKGRNFFARSQYNDITITRPKNWDGQWRFFMFDIPEKSRGLRDILRERMRNLGFFQFQKSVWIYPFECEKEMRYICEYLTTTPYSIMFTAKVDNDKILKRYFYDRGILSRKYLDARYKYLRS